jgi:uncharacterized protein YbjT (DUF2867 family)
MAVFVVAGVTGRVGSVVANTLRARSETPRVLVRQSASGGVWSRRGCEVAVGSLGDQAFLAHALRGADGFFTLLPENVVPDDFHGARCRMADAIAAAVRESGVPHVVMLSALAAALSDGNGPAKDLHYLENRLHASGAKVTRLRACYFQDNISSLVAPAREAGIFPSFTPLDAALPMIATADVGSFVAGAFVDSPSAGDVVDLLGPAYSSRQIAEKLGAALGRSLHVVEIPPEGRVAALTQAGLPRPIAEAVAEMYAAFAAGLVVPNGDQRLVGTTTIDDVIAGCVRHHERSERPA